MPPICSSREPEIWSGRDGECGETEQGRDVDERGGIQLGEALVRLGAFVFVFMSLHAEFISPWLLFT